MVLPEALLFPHSVLPLYIFEDRYRAMLRDALASHRMFCVAMLKPGRLETAGTDGFFHIAGIGLIRACVTNPDGTSQLILQGVARVCLSEFSSDKPYLEASIEPLACQPGDSDAISVLTGRIVSLCEALREQGVELPASLDHLLNGESDPELLVDLVSSAFVRQPLHRQDLLEQPVLAERLRRLVFYLKKETA